MIKFDDGDTKERELARFATEDDGFPLRAANDKEINDHKTAPIATEKKPCPKRRRTQTAADSRNSAGHTPSPTPGIGDSMAQTFIKRMQILPHGFTGIASLTNNVNVDVEYDAPTCDIALTDPCGLHHVLGGGPRGAGRASLALSELVQIANHTTFHQDISKARYGSVCFKHTMRCIWNRPDQD